MISFLERWWTFVRERFEPLSHFVMLSCLFGANISIALTLTQSAPSRLVLALLFAVHLLFFFHLRLFDEIKDCQTDLSVNPTRPLPRGLITMAEFKRVLSAVIGLEFLFVVFVSIEFQSFAPLVTYGVACGYSLLMYREFFIGPWLRPQMEAYAISHTFVSGLFSAFLYLSICPSGSAQNPRDLSLVIFMNWMVFNVFEFARKTFSSLEEKASVESYSSRLAPWGAALATSLFVMLALIAFLKLNDHLIYSKIFSLSILGVSFFVIGAGVYYALDPRSSRRAKFFRGASTAYLVVFNLLIFIAFFG